MGPLLRLVERVQEPPRQLHHDALIRQRARNAVQRRGITLDPPLLRLPLRHPHPLLLPLAFHHRHQIGQEAVQRRDDRQRDGDMDRGRVLERVEMPAPIGHGVGDVVDVERGGGEGDDADERVTDDGEIRGEGGVLADGGLEAFGGADDAVTGLDVALFALGHEGGPAAGDEGAGPGAGDAGGGVDAAGPVGGDEVLVAAEAGGAVEEDGVAFGGEAVFVGVAADAGDAGEGEVERGAVEAGAGEEGDEKGAEAAVDVEGEFAFEGEPGEGGDVVDDAVREVGGGADEEDGVAVDQPGYRGGCYAVGRGGAGDEVDFDFEVGTRFAEGCVGGFGEDPGTWGGELDGFYGIRKGEEVLITSLAPSLLVRCRLSVLRTGRP